MLKFTTPAQIEAAITAYMTKKPGSCPNFNSVGGNEAADPVFDKMIAEGRIVEGTKVSPKGRRMDVLVLAEFAEQFPNH